MSEVTQDLEKFLNDLSADASMQEHFSNMLATTDASSIKDSITTFMKSSGYDVKDKSIDALLQVMKKNLVNTELTDESLDAVSGGSNPFRGIDIDKIICPGGPHGGIRITPGLIDSLNNIK